MNNLLQSLIPLDKTEENEENEEKHISLNDIFKTANDEYKTITPVFSETTDTQETGNDNISKTILNDTTDEFVFDQATLKNTLFYIKNFCSSYLNFQQNLDDVKRVQNNNIKNYNIRFTNPINEIKCDCDEIRYLKINEYLRRVYNHTDVKFSVYLVENDITIEIQDRLFIKNNHYYIQPEIEYIVRQLIYNKIIIDLEILLVDFVDIKQAPCFQCKKTNNKYTIENQKFKLNDNNDIVLNINDFAFCHYCRFNTICLKS